jgi:hypothetical protein
MYHARARVEHDNHRKRILLRRQGLDTLQQGLMAQMHPVEHTDGDD